MILKPVKTTDPLYSQAENLLVEAFPCNERRDLKAQRCNTDNNPMFRCYAILVDNEFSGILTTWTFPTFRYIEHFAISPEKRSAGIGAKALRQFIDMCESPIVLEVEIPLDDISNRRIGFYLRQGFSILENIEYYQPPYRNGDGILPMKLMVSNSMKNAVDIDNVRRNLYHHVYHFSEGE